MRKDLGKKVVTHMKTELVIATEHILNPNAY